MLRRALLYVVGRILGVTLHTGELLSIKDMPKFTAFLQEFIRARGENLPRGRSSSQRILCLVKLPADKKVDVPRRVAHYCGGGIVSGDEISAGLKEQGLDQSKARVMTECLILSFAEGGGNVIVSSGFDSFIAQASLYEKARKARVKIRFCTLPPYL